MGVGLCWGGVVLGVGRGGGGVVLGVGRGGGGVVLGVGWGVANENEKNIWLKKNPLLFSGGDSTKSR